MQAIIFNISRSTRLVTILQNILGVVEDICATTRMITPGYAVRFPSRVHVPIAFLCIGLSCLQCTQWLGRASLASRDWKAEAVSACFCSACLRSLLKIEFCALNFAIPTTVWSLIVTQVGATVLQSGILNSAFPFPRRSHC